jgi:hypothetical protein
MRHFLKFVHGNWSNYACSCAKRLNDFRGLICSLALISLNFSSLSTILFIQTKHFSQMANANFRQQMVSRPIVSLQYIISNALIGGRLKWSSLLNCVCLLSNSLREKKLTENVSVSFVVNILTSQFPQRRVYPNLWKSGGLQVQCVT